MELIEAYENTLSDRLREGLSAIEKVKMYQSDSTVSKTPTIAFNVKGYTPREVCRILAEEHSIFIADGHFYASTLANKLDIIKEGGWVRAGLAPYNTIEEVERLIEAICQL